MKRRDREEPDGSGRLTGTEGVYPGSKEPSFFPFTSGNVELEGGYPVDPEDPNQRPSPEVPNAPNPNPGDDRPGRKLPGKPSDEPIEPERLPEEPNDPPVDPHRGPRD
ncbi:MAG: hypothetical protein JSS66_03415 [Armatimonadetes bacterium]|nr:hypothetical protein [Armatimonadota bacterium]